MNILLVEDNAGDIELTSLAFKRLGVDIALSVAHDGIEAMEALARSVKNRDGSLPDLILLDLNMPRMGGREFLETVKRDERLRLIPVIILSSSGAAADIDDCYRRYANGYIRKPFDFDKYVDMARQIDSFWFKLVRLPVKDSGTPF